MEIIFGDYFVHLHVHGMNWYRENFPKKCLLKNLRHQLFLIETVVFQIDWELCCIHWWDCFCSIKYVICPLSLHVLYWRYRFVPWRVPYGWVWLSVSLQFHWVRLPSLCLVSGVYNVIVTKI